MYRILSTGESFQPIRLQINRHILNVLGAESAIVEQPENQSWYAFLSFSAPSPINDNIHATRRLIQTFLLTRYIDPTHLTISSTAKSA